MMIEFLKQYGPYIVGAVVWIGTNFPIIRKRLISDNNLLKTFGDVKNLTNEVINKKVDINQALIKVDVVQKSIQEKIDIFQTKIDQKMALVDQSITNFMDSELYHKMLNGLDQLDQLKQILENKDTTIEMLGSVIKEMNQNFLEIKNEILKG